MIHKELSQALVSLEVERKGRKRAEPLLESLCGRGNVKQKDPALSVQR